MSCHIKKYSSTSFNTFQDVLDVDNIPHPAWSKLLLLIIPLSLSTCTVYTVLNLMHAINDDAAADNWEVNLFLTCGICFCFFASILAVLSHLFVFGCCVSAVKNRMEEAFQYQMDSEKACPIYYYEGIFIYESYCLVLKGMTNWVTFK